MNRLKICLALLACAFTWNAHAAFFEDDEARRAILDLRQKFDISQQRMTEDGKKSTEDNAQMRRSLLELSNQIEILRGDMASLRGQNEQLSKSLADTQRTQNDLAQEHSRKSESGMVTVDGREFAAEPVEKQEFETALASLHKGEFSAAQTGLLGFINRYPQSGYRVPALFWLANAQYALRDYRSAVANFRGLVAADPTHLRAPEALLSIANCQVELKDQKAARKVLEDLVKAYPQSEAAGVAKERLSKMR